MDVEKLVTSPEISLKLAGLGLHTESIFRWVKRMTGQSERWEIFYSSHPYGDPRPYLYAYTLSDILRLLPYCIDDSESKIRFYLSVKKMNKGDEATYECRYTSLNNDLFMMEDSSSDVEASSLVLIALLEEGLIIPEEPKTMMDHVFESDFDRRN